MRVEGSQNSGKRREGREGMTNITKIISRVNGILY